MTGRRLVSAAVLLGLASLSGCASWCARNYPCQGPVAYAPAAPACCCPAPVAAAPTCQPGTAYSQNWQTPVATPCGGR
jgi:hypothetical protein